MTVTASIVVHKTPPEQLIKALECLKESSVDKLYVIDNSPENKLERFVESYDRLKYFHVENNGFGAGHNIAITAALNEGSTYHLVMNADVWWEGDIIEKLREYMDKNLDVGMVAPKVFYPDGDLQYSCRMLPIPLDLFIKRFLPGKLSGRRMKRFLLEEHDHDQFLNCPYLLGSFLFFRTKALQVCGMFDERFFMYPEDIDITRRIHEKFKTIYWPEVSIIHEHQQASKKNVKMFWIHFTNMIKYFNKWGWIYDSKRKIFNKKLMNSIERIKEGKTQKGRG